MIDKIKKTAMHFWTEHKIIVIVVVAVLVIAIIKQVLVNLLDILKKNVVMVPVVASVIVGTFTGVRYIVSLTETINQNQAAIEKIQKTDLKNQIGYIARIQENQSHLLLNIETNKGNTIVTNDKLKTMEEKIKQMEQDFKNFLIMRSTLVEDK